MNSHFFLSNHELSFFLSTLIYVAFKILQQLHVYNKGWNSCCLGEVRRISLALQVTLGLLL